MKKILSILLTLFVIQNICCAKETIQFDFPNEGWHKITSPDQIESKKCYVPYNQTSENYSEMLIFYERLLKNQDIGAMTILHKQLGKDRNNYTDIIPEYIKQDMNDAMVTWCSKINNVCAVERAFRGENGVIVSIYLNKAPHYSQNMFGQWSNILSNVKLYIPKQEEKVPNNLIEL